MVLTYVSPVYKMYGLNCFEFCALLLVYDEMRTPGSNMPYIIGGVLGGLVIIGIVVIVVVCVLKKNQQTHPMTQQNPQQGSNEIAQPPAYALAPPPPYVYDPPSPQNKWVENEIIDQKQGETTGQRPNSVESGSSFERKLTSKESDNLLPNQISSDKP